MAKNLVIVESPTKAKTITKFLSKNYRIMSSYGHIRDLPARKFGIDLENDFEPSYVVSKDKKPLLKELNTAAKGAETIYFATDEDREGEAISWHLMKLMEKSKADFKRIAFHEITKKAVEKAIENPRELDTKMVDAQQARRILDRIVGYKLSPLLWKKIAKGLSAGRVQSVAVRLIVEREREIQAFKPEEYWTIEGLFAKDKDVIESKLIRIDDKKLEKFDINNEKKANEILDDLKGADFNIEEINKRDVKKSQPAPFTTSTLQQEAYNKIGFSSKQTMFVAQSLYEGMAVGKDHAGLITYMRTDSHNLSSEFLGEAREYIDKNFGKKYLPEKAIVYKTKSKQAQEAHEAIRPTDVNKNPEDIKSHLDEKQYKLYKLIWQRAVASQMEKAVVANTTLYIKGKKYTFSASGSQIKFPGWMEIYPRSAQDKILPEIEKGEKLEAKDIKGEQHFTEPPARYNDASLVKKMEELGIGRPSTYAPTIATIQNRNYINREGRQLVPQEIAFMVTDLLTEHFPDIVDYDFTAEMEEGLDDVAEGKKQWVPLIRQFYKPFSMKLEQKYDEIKKAEEETDYTCDKCGKPMVIKMSRFGKFLACTGFPDCRNTKSVDEDGNIKEDEDEKPGDEKTEEKCEKCGEPMIMKTGRFGKFLACSGYPKCKNTKAIDQDTGVKCPKCEKGNIVAKKTKNRRTFYACDQYPDCKFTVWAKPTGEKCPDCKSLLVNGGKDKVKCSDKECGYEKDAK